MTRLNGWGWGLGAKIPRLGLVKITTMILQKKNNYDLGFPNDLQFGKVGVN
jgi:hypothetical protein